MRHQQHDKQQTNCDRGQQESLKIPEWRRCEECGETALQRPHTSEERRLKAWAPARSLRDLEQQLSVRCRIAESRYDAIVAVYLDREAQPAQLPPHGEVPRHQYERERRNEKQVRVV